MSKKGLIVINGYFINDAVKHQIESLKQAFNKRGVTVDLIKGNELDIVIDGYGVKHTLPDYDFIIYLDKEILRAQMLEKAGYKLFNGSEVIRVCDDKALTYVTLVGSGIKMPKTVFSPLNYTGIGDGEFLSFVEKTVGYPVVVKSAYGSMGKGVYKADNREQLEKLYSSLKTLPHLYQKFIGKGGRDIRVIVIGGKVVASMERVNEKDFRSNVEQGGIGKKIELDKTATEIAQTVAKTLNADYLGIDILFDGEEYYLCEANSNAFFKGITNATGIDVAEFYAKHILEKIN